MFNIYKAWHSVSQNETKESVKLIGAQNLKICTHVMEKIFSSIHSLNGALRYQKKGNV